MCFHLVVNVIVILLLAGAAHANKPQPGGPAPAERREERPRPEPEDPARQRYVASVEARGKADLLRATYESAHKPGPVAEKDQKQFEEVVQAYRAAIDIDPRSEIAGYCRQRLAGAYTYTQDFEAALRIFIEAVNVATGPDEQIKACVGAAYHCLQAMHQPEQALRWFRRAEALLNKIEDDAERTKWRLAIEQGTQRCTPAP